MLDGVRTIRRLILDIWTSLSFKDAVNDPRDLTKSWVAASDRRRLAAYRMLCAYIYNTAREYLHSLSEKDRASHREYGDCALTVERIVAGILGDDMQIVVDGADADLAEAPVLPDPPPPLADDASDIERAAWNAQQAVYEERARQAIEEWQQAWAEQPVLVERQEWLREWADDELFPQRVWENENQAVGLGDGVYVFSVSARARRVVVRVYDPGFYFPVLDAAAEARGYPLTVHLAWDEDTDDDGVADHLRRITYRLGPIRPRMAEDRSGNLVPAVRTTMPGPGGEDIAVDLPAGDRDEPTLIKGDTFNPATGMIERRYPWQAEDDEPSTITCFMSDGLWELRDVKDSVYDLDPRRARYLVNEEGIRIRELDLMHDEIPVVHVPNTPATQAHFGQSSIARVLQLADDIADTDSDLQAAAALAGTPMVGIESEGGVPDTITVAPGAVVTGKLTPLDLSASVTALREVAEDLRDLWSVNSQVSAEVLGRVKANEVPSGVTLAFGLGPYRSLIATLRLVRDHKYRLALRLVQRMSQAADWLPPGLTLPARLAFGSFLPSDRSQLVEEVVKLVRAHLLSRASGLRLLVAGGVEVDDIPEELRRIQAEDFEGAVSLASATGDDDCARTYLGIPDDPNNPSEPEPDDVVQASGGDRPAGGSGLPVLEL